MESNSFLKVGAMLNHDKYRIERYLASGGFGNTYEGVNVSLGKKCAIKEFFLKGIAMRNEQTTDVHIAISDNKRIYNSQREKFTKEARRLSSLDNTHIVRVFDFFEENGTAYYVMDYIEGESLREYQKRTGKALTEQEALSVLTQMLDALETIHEAGLQHMDIKPANIMIDQKGKCTLIDFGASKQTTVSDGATTSSTMAYTPGYAPTEQIGGSSDRWGPWTDFYALGATLYNLLTKENPGELDIEEDGVDTFKFTPDISTPTRSLIQWMMSPKRKDRPQNVGEIRVYLKEKEINAEEPLIAEGGDNTIPVKVDDPTKYVEEVEATEIDEASQEDTPTESDGKNTVYVSAASVDENAVVNQPDDTPKINDEKGKDKKRKSNVGKRVTYFLLSLLIVAGMVFFINSLNSDKKKEIKTEKTSTSSKTKKTSEAKVNNKAKSKTDKKSSANKESIVRQENQRTSSKTPSQKTNPSQGRVIIKPYPGKNSDLLRGKTIKNNPEAISQTNSHNRNVTPLENQQSKNRNATSSNGQNKKAEKVKPQANVQAVKQQNRNANSSTSAQSVKNKQSEIDAAWGNVDNSNSAKANEIDAAW